MKQSNIQINIHLDENNVPEKIEWSASDHPEGEELHPAKAMMIAFFDEEHRDTLRFDLWTKAMQLQEMDRFMFFSLKSMADTYFKSSGNKELANQMQQFAEYFGKTTEIIK